MEHWNLSNTIFSSHGSRGLRVAFSIWLQPCRKTPASGRAPSGSWWRWSAGWLHPEKGEQFFLICMYRCGCFLGGVLRLLPTRTDDVQYPYLLNATRCLSTIIPELMQWHTICDESSFISGAVPHPWSNFRILQNHPQMFKRHFFFGGGGGWLAIQEGFVWGLSTPFVAWRKPVARLPWLRGESHLLWNPYGSIEFIGIHWPSFRRTTTPTPTTRTPRLQDLHLHH